MMMYIYSSQMQPFGRQEFAQKLAEEIGSTSRKHIVLVLWYLVKTWQFLDLAFRQESIKQQKL